MHAAHIAVTVFMAMCAAGALLALSGAAPGLLAISMYLGWWATVGAVLISLAVVAILIARIQANAAGAYLKRSWLALANGLVALVFLGWFVTHVS